jgi:signal transduction histidine kinase
VRSADELGDLAASFNKMTAEVAGEQGRIEEQVRRKTAELERVYKTLLSNEKLASIGKLAATVAHEINNPLFGILTYSKLDNGGGIPADVMSHIFDPFFTTKQDQNRTGLGLAVARSIVDQHGGENSVRSEPGQGTEFTVALSLEPIGETSEPRPSASVALTN